ncbi:hypothetical protein [Methylorubrum extorquens]|nr:hypothetical protein [Methylorubrum extorquens]MCP1537686.1 C4-dicarboxylate-specific signal transduction histidine kinase [Methylorubrum extorquens]
MKTHDPTIEHLLDAAEKLMGEGRHKEASALLERIHEMLGVMFG